MTNQSSLNYKTFLLAAIVGLSLFLVGRLSVKYWQEKTNPLKEMEKNLPDLTLPEEDFENTNLSLDSQDDSSISEINQGGKLKALNANLVGIWEENQLTGLRIVGEVENIGQETVFGAKSVVRFYNQSDPESTEPIATKIGQWNQSYRFLPLQPGEIIVYDLLIPDPPESERITVELKPTAGSEEKSANISGVNLKIKQKNLEESSLPRGDQDLAYFKFSALLVNTSEEEIINPTLFVWLKDDQDKVIAAAYKTYEADLLTPNQELESNLILIPFSPGSGQTFTYEIKTFAESL